MFPPEPPVATVGRNGAQRSRARRSLARRSEPLKAGTVLRFASKPFGTLGQRDSLRIGKPQRHRQMASQNPILCDQVLVAEQQILIHTPLQTPGGVSSGIDRAWWNVHHNEQSVRDHPSLGYLAERELRDNAFCRPC
jgi:hypothetical protein